MTDVGHVVIVGGSKGLGKLLAERFARQGNLVTVMSRSRPDINVPVNHVSVDLEIMTSCADIVNEAISYGGKIKYLIFCQRYRGAGDPWHGEIQVTLTATRLLINEFADRFCHSGDRAVAVVSSVYAEFVGGSQPDGYHVSKAALNQLVRYNAWALGRKGIRINAVMPLTYLKAESKDRFLKNDDLMGLYKSFIPLGKMGEAEDSANLVEFLCSRKSSFINGQAIFIDGGVSVIWPEELAKSLTSL